MKQRETAQSKTTPSTQERLIARETFQYVTTNPRKYGVASTRNERQLAKAMDSLHMQQNKRLTTVAAPRGGLGGTRPPPFLTEANFLIRPNPMRKGGGGGGTVVA